MIVRYIKQRDKYNCAPVAMINALKWAGEKVTYKELNKLKKLCNCEPPNGTWSNNLYNALGKDSRLVRSKCVKEPTLSEIDEWLDKGNVVIIRYDWWLKAHYRKVNQYSSKKVPGRWVGHYILISGRYPRYYIVHNNNRYSSSVWSRRRARHYLSNDKRSKSHAWFIRKR